MKGWIIFFGIGIVFIIWFTLEKDLPNIDCLNAIVERICEEHNLTYVPIRLTRDDNGFYCETLFNRYKEETTKKFYFSKEELDECMEKRGIW